MRFDLFIQFLNIFFLLLVYSSSSLFAVTEECSESFEETSPLVETSLQAELPTEVVGEYFEFLLEKYSKDIDRFIHHRARQMDRRKDTHFKEDLNASFKLRLLQTLQTRDAFNKLREIEEQGQIRNYFSGMIKNLSIDYLRENKITYSLNPPSSVGETEIFLDVSDPFVDVYSHDANIIKNAVAFLPVEQRELIESEALIDSNGVSLIHNPRLEITSPVVLRERRELAYRNLEVYENIEFNTSFFRTGRRDNPNRRTVSKVWLENDFYDVLALLTPSNRAVLGSYLIERLSREEIQLKYGYQNILSVSKQINRAMSLFKNYAGLNDLNEVRVDTMVVMLREEGKLLGRRKRFYDGASLLEIHEAKKFGDFNPNRDLDRESLDQLLKLMNPVHADVINLIFRRGYSEQDVANFLKYDDEAKVHLLLDHASLELSILTKNPRFRRNFISALRAKTSELLR